MYFEHGLSLYLLLFIPVLFVLHYFKNRKTEELSSSLLLWKQVVSADSKQKHHRFNFNVTLLLLCASLLFASLGAASPKFSTDRESQHISIVIDSSASMTADSAFNSSKTEIISLLSNLADNAKVTLVSAENLPRILCRASSPTAARRALSELKPVFSSSDISAAILLASQTEANVKPVVFSDMVVETSTPCFQKTFGNPIQNRGFVAATISQNKLFFVVANYSKAPFRGKIVLSTVSPNSFSMSISLKPMERKDFTLELSEELPEQFSFEITPADSFPADSKLYIRKQGDSFVKIALQGLNDKQEDFGVLKAISALVNSGFIGIKEVFIPDSEPIEKIDADCLISVKGNIAVDSISVPAILFQPDSGTTFSKRTSGSKVKGTIVLSDRLHLPFLLQDGSCMGFEKNEIFSAPSYFFSKKWKTVLSCGDESVLVRSADTYIATFLPFISETDWIQDPSFLIFIGHFVKQAGKSSSGFALRKTDSKNLSIGFSKNGAFNLLSDSESNLLNRVSANITGEIDTGLVRSESGIPFGSFLLFLAGFLFVLSVISLHRK